MKTYNFTDLKKIIKDQGYISGGLEDQHEKRILSFNNPTKKAIDKHLIDIEKRLNSDIFEDGPYFVLLALAINKQKIADKYRVYKGIEVKPEDAKKTILNDQGNNVLSYATAIQMNADLANLRAEITSLKKENEELKNSIEELEEEEEEINDLSNPGAETNNFATLIKEHAPTLMAIADKFFNLEERKIELKEKELSLKSLIKPQTPKQILPGTKEHLALIEFYYKNANEEKLNLELNKLFEVNPELYDQVINKMEEVKNG